MPRLGSAGMPPSYPVSPLSWRTWNADRQPNVAISIGFHAASVLACSKQR
jgi:hypothetical protein